MKQISTMEKEKAILNEKVVNLEKKIKEMVNNYEREIEKQSNLISDMKLENDQNTDNYNKEIESFKFRNMQLELELKDKKTGNFEKEKITF